MVIHPAAISIIRRDRLPVCGARARAVDAASSAGAAVSTGGGSPAEAVSLARRLVGIVEAVAKSTDGCDHVGPQLLANPGDEDLDRVGIAVEILIVDMLDQFGAADHL